MTARRADSPKLPTATMTRPRSRAIAPRQLRGSIAITAAIWIFTIVIILGVVDVGHIWWERSHLHNVADMMALAGAQRFDDTCGGAQTAVSQIASSNGYTGTYTVQCGRYETSTNTFTAIADSTDPTINAVNVLLSSSVTYWFMPMVGKNSQGIQVESTSRVVNIDAFTLSTTLLSVQSGNSVLLNGLLNALLGSGTVNLNVASYQALAAAQVKLSDLAVQLNSNGANDIVQMLSTTPTLTTLLRAISNALPATDASQAALSQLIGSSNTTQGGTTVPMNGSNNQVGLLDIGLQNVDAASNATVDALDAVMVAAQVANASGGTVAPINLDLSLFSGLPVAPGVGTKLEVALGQPPVLAVGEAGTSSTVARSSQIKLYLDLYVSTTGPDNFLSLLPAGINIEVPLYLAVANGQASLTKTNCGAGVSDSWAEMQVQPSVLQACITTSANAKQLFNSAPIGPAPSCTGSTVQLANVSVSLPLSGSQTLIGVDSTSVQAVAQPASSTVTFTGVGNQITSQNPAQLNSNDLGQDLNSVLSNGSGSVLSQLANNVTVTVPALPVVGDLVTLLLQDLNGIVGGLITTTVAGVVNAVVPPLLTLLGAQVGSASVTDLSLTCGNVQLVQ